MLCDPMRRVILLLSLLMLTLPSACRHGRGANGGPETAPTGPSVLTDSAVQSALHGTVSFAHHIKPVLQSRCVVCHDGKTMPGLFALTSRDAAFQPGARGARIVPGHPEKSLLFLNPKGTHGAVKAMPPVGNRLTADELNILGRWIKQGAEWPSGAAGRLTPAQ